MRAPVRCGGCYDGRRRCATPVANPAAQERGPSLDFQAIVALAVHLLILWAAITVGLAMAWLLARRTSNAAEGKFGPALGFIGSSFGLLLGLLVVFAANHYSTTRTAAETEATAFVAMFNDVAGLPSPTRERVQHDIVCYMRSIVTDDWVQQEQRASHQDEEARAHGDALSVAARAGWPASSQSESIRGRVATKLTEADQARQSLLFLAQPTIPTIIWIVVFVGVAVLMFLVGSELRIHGLARFAALGSLTIMLSFAIGVLVSLDHPFSQMARIQPAALNRALELLSDPPTTGTSSARATNRVMAPCRVLSAPDQR